MLALALALPSLALEEPSDTVEQPGLDRSKDWLAKKIDGFSGALDSFFIERFFSDAVLEDDIEGNRAIISLHTRREIGGDVEYFLDGRVRVVLPKTNERLKLLISSDDDSEHDVDRDPLRSVEKASYSTALRFILLESNRWKSDFDVGVHWHGLPDPYTRWRLRRYIQLGQWSTRITQSFYHYALEKSGEKTDIRGDYNLSDTKLLRLSTAAEYTRKNAYFDVSYGIDLYQRLTNKSMLVYSLGASGDTEKEAVFKYYVAGLRYRRLIYKDWIFAEVYPQQEWRLDNSFRRQPVIMFRIEAVIE